MATKKYEELRNLSQDEMKTKLRELEANLFQTRMKKVTGQLEDTASLWRIRKTIARIKMLQTQAHPKNAKAAAPATKAVR